MAKRDNTYDINLRFTADARSAANELEALKNQLSNISNGAILKTPNFQLTNKIQEATNAAMQLKVQLEDATNVNTGQLDLTRFNDSLKKSGMSLQEYQRQLKALGPNGEKAFVNLSKAITTAEVPLKRNSKLMSNLWLTMKNTAKWQISSSIMHGFIGAVRSAFGYVKDLNESLNNIRIVTGLSVEEMASFAEQANKAAKALNTTTNEYAKASLIFYQQGLSTSQVLQRTDVTIKMANVVGESAQKISDQLTAVWNNFYNGSKSLEYYADVMTALGAATASSSDEIAGGLEKFAAIGNTIGLSYEYAASALATITANTRQSEEVVGTALKTIFARIQGLNLGETLDDGTTLNKYSNALAKVGVNIFEQNGELKAMDNILDEIGAKWETLAKDQQIALAQTVAGVRQYNQLVSLMSNWNSGDSDSMVANLETAYGSEGTLQEQADIYAESWEAASKNVRASMEQVYRAILNDEFFIDLTKGFAKITDGVSLFIDSLGGIKGVLLAIGSIITMVFQKQITQSINNLVANIKMRLPGGAEAMMKQKQQVNQMLIDQYSQGGGSNAKVYKLLGENQLAYINNAKNMSEEEQKINQMIMDRNRLLADNAIKQNENLDAINKTIEAEKRSMGIQVQRNKASGQRFFKSTFDKSVSNAEKSGKAASFMSAVSTEIPWSSEGMTDEQIKSLKMNTKELFQSFAQLETLDTDEDFRKLAQALGVSEDKTLKLKAALDPTNNDLVELNNTIGVLSTATMNNSEKEFEELRKKIEQLTGSSDMAEQIMKDFKNTLNEHGYAVVNATNAHGKLKKQVDQSNKKMNATQKKSIGYAEAFTRASSAVMSLGMAFSSLQGVVNTFNSDASTGEKIMSLIMAIGMLVPAIMSIVPAFSAATVASETFAAAATAAGTKSSIAMWKITLIVAAIAALATVIALVVTAETEAEKSAKAAAKAADQMAESAENAAQQLQAIENAFSQYDEVVKKLEECTKGTEEWKEALQDVNKAAIDILNDSPMLASIPDLFTRNEYGMLELDEQKRNEALQQAQNQENLLSAMSVITKAKSSNQNYLNQLSSLQDTYKMNLTNQSSTFVMDIMDWFAGIETKSFSFDKNSLSKNLNNLVGIDKNTYNERVKEIIENEIKNAGLNINDYSENIKQATGLLMSQYDSLQRIGEGLEKTADQIDKAWQLLVDAEVGTGYGGIEKTAASRLLKQQADELADIYERLFRSDSGDDFSKEELKAIGYSNSIGISKGDGSESPIYDFIVTEIEKAGIGLYGASGNTVKNIDSNRVFVFNDASGNPVERDARWVAETLATEKALEELEKELGNVTKTLDEFEKGLTKADESRGLDASTYMKELLASGTLAGGTFEEFQKFSTLMGERNDPDWSKNNNQGVLGSDSFASYTDVGNFAREYYGKDGKIDPATLAMFGVESEEEFFDKIYQEYKNQYHIRSQLVKDLTLKKQNSPIVDLENLTLESATNLSNTAKQFQLGPNGEEMRDDYLSLVKGWTEEVAEDKQAAFVDKVSQINWSLPDANSGLESVLKEFNIAIDSSDEEWENFTENLQETTVPDFSTLKTDLSEISSLVEDLDFGSVIKDEDYQKLIDYKEEWQEFFQMQADGSYKFIGGVSSEELVQATRDEVNARRSKLKDRAEINAAIDEAEKDGENIKDAVYWSNLKGSNNREEELNALLNDENYIKAIESLGYDKQEIQDIHDNLISNDEEAKKLAGERADVLFDKISTLRAESYETEAQLLDEMMASTATSFNELQELYNAGAIGDSKAAGSAYAKQLTVLANEGAAAAKSLSELQGVMQSATQYSQSGEVHEALFKTYEENLLRLAEAYSICTQEIQEYQKATTESDKQEALKTLETLVELGDAANEYGLNAEELKTQMMLLEDSLGENAKAAPRLAVQNQRMNKGIEELSSNWLDWLEILQDSKSSTLDQAKALNGLTEAVRDLTGAGEELVLTTDFIEEYRETIEEAAKGNTDAINELGLAVAKFSIGNLEEDKDFWSNINDYYEENSENPFKSYEEDFDTYKDRVTEGIETLQYELNNLEPNTDVMDTLGKDWIEALNAMAYQTGMSVDEMNSLLNQMGLDADVTVTQVPLTSKTPKIVYESKINHNDDGSITMTTTPKQDGTVTTTSMVEVPSINGDADITYIGNGNTSSSITSSGESGSKFQKAEKKNSLDRYYSTTKQLEKIDEVTKDLNRNMDNLYGEDRLDQIDKINEALEDENEILEKQKQEAQGYLKEDKENLKKGLREVIKKLRLKVKIETDDSGNILNIEEIFSKLDEEYNDLVKDYNDITGNDLVSQNKRDKIQEEMDEVGSAIDYVQSLLNVLDETLNKIEETENEILDNANEILSNNYTKITQKLNDQLEIASDELKVINYYSNKTKDNFFAMAEGFAQIGKKGKVSNEVIKIHKETIEDLKKQYKTRVISEASFREGISKSKDALFTELETLNVLDKEMLDYYGDTLSMAGEELDKYIERMDHLNSVLDHYKSLLGIIGEESNYEAMGVILEGAAKSAENALTVAKAEYELYKTEADNKKSLYEEALKNSNAAAAEVYLKEWEAAEAAARESQDNLLSKTEEWAEAMKAVVENELSGFAKTLEQALTGGTSFDEMTTSMDRVTSLQEEYLTATNKIYETTKLMRTAQKALDETSNTAAKNRLKSFIEETEHLQNQGELSQYELDIQQAKYDLLLAEIALEEAQNAKSVVRLRRDSEGNFGYVYTADQNQVADAEQQVADAQNALYNKGLEGANNYVEKYQQTMSEMYDILSELSEAYLNGEIATQEEYDRKKTEATEYYYQKLIQYSHLYQEAIGVDSAIIEEAWSTEFAEMTFNTEEWMNAVNTYTDNCGKSFETWQDVIAKVKETTGGDLDELKEKVANIVTESEALTDAITKENGVIDALEKELKAVSELTTGYANQRQALLDLIKETEKYLGLIDEDDDGSSTGGSSDGSSTGGNNDGFSTEGGENNSSDTGTFSDKPKAGDIVKVKSTATRYLDGGKMSDWVPGNSFEVLGYRGEGVRIGNPQGPYHKDIGYTGTVKLEDLEGYKTGGYTGVWGPEGKLAMLHQKELILNEQDTPNILAAVEILRTLDIHTISAQLGGILRTPDFYNTNSGVIDQNVRIEASFPNVQDHNEIEEAFNNLINKASQYANRR